MENNKSLFQEYSEKKTGFSKYFNQSKFWLSLFIVVIGVFLLIIFYKYVIKESMSPEDVKNSIQIVWHNSKWVDKEVTPYETKIVPSINLKIKNIGKKPLKNVGFHGIFKFEETGEVHSDGRTMALREPLPPGETSKEIFIKSLYGYTASSKAAFIKNKKEWKKIAVKIFASTKGSGLVPLNEEYPIKQEIEGINVTYKAEEKKNKEKFIKNFEEIGKSLQVIWHASNWVEKRATSSKTLIVPSIIIKIKNIGDKPIQNLYFKGVFEFEKTEKKLGEGYTPAKKKFFSKGDISGEILIKSDLGYTASSMAAFINNIAEWKNVKVKIFVRTKESGYILLGIYPIKKEIEGVKVIYQPA